MLKSIDYYAQGNLSCLTFVFSEKTRSPPAKSYLNEPKEILLLEEQPQTLTFGCDARSVLISLKVDKNEIKGTNEVKQTK
jgi:hypothetical protein